MNKPSDNGDLAEQGELGHGSSQLLPDLRVERLGGDDLILREATDRSIGNLDALGCTSALCKARDIDSTGVGRLLEASGGAETGGLGKVECLAGVEGCTSRGARERVHCAGERLCEVISSVHVNSVLGREQQLARKVRS